MRISFEVAGRAYAADLARGISLAIALFFDGPQPSFFGAAKATSEAVKSGDWVGDTRQGGSCNVRSYRFVTHCNGTHTECIGHLVDEAVGVAEKLPPTPVPATLITVKPEANIIGATALQAALLRHPLNGFHRALIVRTLPNGDDKLIRRYEGAVPAPYFSEEAAALLVQMGVEHLLTDIPSLDPAEDQGRMAAHRVFWGLPHGHRLADVRRPQCTLTELIYAPDSVADGYYLLDLQIPAFMTDAAPSRPVIYPVG